MKIRFLKGTTLAGGIAVNPGDVRDVSSVDAHRFVKIYRDAEAYTEPAKVGEPAKVEEPAEVPAESKKGKSKL
jgi:hypothetical protein